MRRCFLLIPVFLVAPSSLRADAFDHYINPILARLPGSAGVEEVKQLTPDLIADNDRVLANLAAAFVVVKTNDGRFSKLLVQAGQRKVSDEPRVLVPVGLVERYVTYRDGTEQAVQVSGANVQLYKGFHFSLDLGQVVPPELGGDLRFVAEGKKSYLEPIGKAKMYLVTKTPPLPGGKKPIKPMIGEVFEPRYFNGTYKLYDDGRRAGKLTLEVNEQEGEVTGSYISEKDGQKYEVVGKITNPKHFIQFTVKFPQTMQQFQGYLFTGDGKAITGTTRLQEREAGFYAVRVEEE
jgi:hypothetical protein